MHYALEYFLDLCHLSFQFLIKEEILSYEEHTLPHLGTYFALLWLNYTQFYILLLSHFKVECTSVIPITICGLFFFFFCWVAMVLGMNICLRIDLDFSKRRISVVLFSCGVRRFFSPKRAVTEKLHWEKNRWKTFQQLGNQESKSKILPKSIACTKKAQGLHPLPNKSHFAIATIKV